MLITGKINEIVSKSPKKVHTKVQKNVQKMSAKVVRVRTLTFVFKISCPYN